MALALVAAAACGDDGALDGDRSADEAPVSDPSAEASVVETFVREVDAEVAVVRLVQSIEISADGELVRLDVVGEGSSGSDGEYVWHSSSGAGGGTPGTTVWTLDGVEVAEVPAEVAERVDPVVTDLGDGQSAFEIRVADRVFDAVGDAEGNAEITNEDGRSIHGDTYSGFHTFRSDGSRVAYADFTTGTGPHDTKRIHVRDTDSGELVWTLELPEFLAELHWMGDDVLVVMEPMGMPQLRTAAVVDGESGERATEFDAPFGVLYVN